MKHNSPYTVIIGCGRLGALLAERCEEVKALGVAVVDKDNVALSRLPKPFGGFSIVGDAREYEVLKTLDIHLANRVFVVTDDDNVNLMIAQMIREQHGAIDVLIRLKDPAKQVLCKKLKIQVVSATSLTADAMIGATERSEDRCTFL